MRDTRAGGLVLMVIRGAGLPFELRKEFVRVLPPKLGDVMDPRRLLATPPNPKLGRLACLGDTGLAVVLS